ncbi:MAG: glycosyltransferase family 2 protein [Caldisericales bacterium]|nr:glycosyltransferase family 2 protein [Caldisericales bacterium]
MKKNKPRVCIIILNWNGWKDTIECLESLYQIEYDNFMVLLIDNHSADESINMIRNYTEGKLEVQSKFINYSNNNKPIKTYEFTNEEAEKVKFNRPELYKTLIIIKNDKNYGFAEGNNIGIRFALNCIIPQYILLLNNDTIVDPLFLDELIIAAESDPKIGIIGPIIYYYDYYGRHDVVWFSGGEINWCKYPGYHHMTKSLTNSNGYRECDWVSGAALMMNTKRVNRVELNREFHFDCEDVDYCLNELKHGLKAVVVLNAKIWHKIGVSRRKRYSYMINGKIRDELTNFKLIKIHNRFYVLFTPIYIVQMVSHYTTTIFKILIKKLYRFLFSYLRSW